MWPPLARTEKHCDDGANSVILLAVASPISKPNITPALASARQFDWQHEVQEAGGIDEEIIQGSYWIQKVDF